jgi:hypothetical protein
MDGQLQGVSAAAETRELQSGRSHGEDDARSRKSELNSPVAA